MFQNLKNLWVRFIERVTNRKQIKSLEIQLENQERRIRILTDGLVQIADNPHLIADITYCVVAQNTIRNYLDDKNGGINSLT